MKLTFQLEIEISNNISFSRLVLEIAKVSKQVLIAILLAIQNQLVNDLCGEKYSKNYYEYKRTETKNRTLKTSIGTINFKIIKIKKKGEKKFSPLEVMLGIEKRKCNTKDILFASMKQVFEQSYRKSITTTKDMLNVTISRSSLWRFVQATKMSISKPKERIDVVIADDTCAKSQDKNYKEHYFRHVIGLNFEKMQYFLLKVAVNESWENIAKSVAKFVEIDRAYLVSDADRGIINAFKKHVKDNQICLRHVIEYVSYSLWYQGASKNYRKKVKKNIQQMLFTLVNSTRKTVVTERLNVRLGMTHKQLKQLAKDLRKKGYNMAASFIEIHIDEITTFARAAKEGITIPYTNNREEREMREFGYRAKRIGARWSEDGLQNLSLKKFIRRLDKENFIKFENNFIGGGSIKININPLGG